MSGLCSIVRVKLEIGGQFVSDIVQNHLTTLTQDIEGTICGATATTAKECTGLARRLPLLLLGSSSRRRVTAIVIVICIVRLLRLIWI